jgi:uridine kinase
METVKIIYKEKIFEEEKGIQLVEIANRYQKEFNFDIVGAQVDGELVGLDFKVHKDSKIDFYDRSSQDGYNIYEKTLHFILVAAVKRLFKKDVIIEHSIDKGFYCEVNDIKLTEEEVANLEKTMFDIVEEDHLIKKVSISRLDAIQYYKSKKQNDKVNLLKYISNTYVNLYVLDGNYDYFFSDLAHTTKSINNFKLKHISTGGFVVSLPTIFNPIDTLEYTHHPLIFDAFTSYTNWGKFLKINNISDFNNAISIGKHHDFIRLSETYYEQQLARIADKINSERDKVKVILMSGPSSSGKTTTSHKLEYYLNNLGINTHQISIDDYFKNRIDTPKDENGEYDFESLYSIELELFNNHLSALLKGETVSMPEYSFIKGEKEYKGKTLRVRDDDIIIVEGLHALNDELTSSLDNNCKKKVYISPLTHLNIDNHNRIYTSDLRRIRRLVRDYKFRGYSASETLRMWKKIRNGEEKYIFPYQDEADFVVNSALLYEIAVLKVYAEPILYTVSSDDEVYHEAKRLINFLRNFLAIPSELVPKDSVLREFIGN